MFLDYVSKYYAISHSEDGHGKPLLSYDLILERSKLAAVSLVISLSGVAANCHFFEVDHMEMDVLPEDVNTPEKAQSVFEFMIAIARLLKKEVFTVAGIGEGDAGATQGECALYS